jgi:integrase
LGGRQSPTIPPLASTVCTSRAFASRLSETIGKSIHVRRNVYWKKGEPIIDAPKGKKAKPIPATPRLPAALRACRHFRGERLLYTDESELVTPKILTIWIMRAEVEAGLPKTGRLHVFRHTYASHLVMAGVPARTVQELCRHATLDVTMRYMHLSPNAVDEGIQKLVESREQGGQAVTPPRRRETPGWLPDPD